MTVPVILGIVFAIIGLVKDGKKWASFLALAIFLIMGVFDAMESANKAETIKTIENVKNKNYLVKYEVLANSSFDVNYTNSTGGNDNSKGVSHWERTVTLKGSDFAYLSAQKTAGSGSITVNLYVNGVLKQTSTSSGEYSIADASCYPYKP